jgi:hypothetical protein
MLKAVEDELIPKAKQGKSFAIEELGVTPRSYYLRKLRE